MTPERQQYYNDEFDKLNKEREQAKGEGYSQLQTDVNNGKATATAAYTGYMMYNQKIHETYEAEQRVKTSYDNGEITEQQYTDDIWNIYQTRNSYTEQGQREFETYINYTNDPELAAKEADLANRDSNIKEVDEKTDKLNEQYNEEVAVEATQQDGEKNKTNNDDKNSQPNTDASGSAKSETNNSAKEPGQPGSTNPENEI